VHFLKEIFGIKQETEQINDIQVAVNKLVNQMREEDETMRDFIVRHLDHQTSIFDEMRDIVRQLSGINNWSPD
jgi:ferritin